MIEVQALVKHFGELVAVDGLSFQASAGQIFGLLGPNGAGKSTTISCLSGLVPPTSGAVRVAGHDMQREPQAAKRGLGIVPQEIALYEDLSARENLRFWAGLHGLAGSAFDQRAAELLDAVGLTDRAKEPVKQFSGGMQRRLNFACGVVHRPAVLLCDEPTAGVDPQSRVHLLDLVRAERDAGTCVLYTTHYMEEAEELCDELLIVDHGKAIASGTLAELRAQAGEKDLLLLQGRFEADVDAALLAGAGFELLAAEETQLHLAATDAPHKLAGLFARLESAGAEVSETQLRRPSLESLFIKLTGRELRE